MSHFLKLGVQMWPARAEQVYQTLSKFSKAQIATALKHIYGTDRSLRDVFPDARIVMEGLILDLTAGRQ